MIVDQMLLSVPLYRVSVAVAAGALGVRSTLAKWYWRF